MPDGRYFAFLEPAEESALLAAGVLKTFQRNELVLAQNVPQRALFVIEHGSVKIERENGATMVPLAILARGELFGESVIRGRRPHECASCRSGTYPRFAPSTLADSATSKRQIRPSPAGCIGQLPPFSLSG